jgi:hypothetical protein
LKYYQHITQLPLSKFIDALVDGNLQTLVIEGPVGESELAAAWMDLQQDYAAAIGDNEYKLYLSVYKEVFTLSIKIHQVYLLVDTLKKYYVKPFAVQLNKLLKTSFTFDHTQKEAYEQKLNGCLTRIKGSEITLAKKKIQLRALEEKMTTGEKPSREYFINMLIALSDHAKIVLKAEDMTVYEYVQRIKRLNKHINQK